VDQLPHAVLADRALALAGAFTESLLTAARGSEVYESRIFIGGRGGVGSDRWRAHVLALDRIEFADWGCDVPGTDILALHRIENADGDLRRGCGEDGRDEAGQSDIDGGCLPVGCWLQGVVESVVGLVVVDRRRRVSRVHIEE
jgi:hypothetical protein